MNKRLLVGLFIAMLLILTGCKDNKKEDSVTKNKTKVQKKVTKQSVLTNETLGSLSYYIPEEFTLNSTSTDTLKNYDYSDERTKITVTIAKKEGISVSLEDYMKTDSWKPDVSSLDKVKYNDQEWYIKLRDEYLMYSKYNGDVYQIKIEAEKDETNYANKLVTFITNSLIFNK